MKIHSGQQRRVVFASQNYDLHWVPYIRTHGCAIQLLKSHPANPVRAFVTVCKAAFVTYLYLIALRVK